MAKGCGIVRSIIWLSGRMTAEAAASLGAESKMVVFTMAAADPAAITPMRASAVAVVVFMGSPFARRSDFHGKGAMPEGAPWISKGHPRTGVRSAVPPDQPSPDETIGLWTCC